MSDNLFDAAAFSLELRLAMARANLSLRQLASIIGSDQATIHRVTKHEKPPCVEGYLRMRRWMDQQKDPAHER